MIFSVVPVAKFSHPSHRHITTLTPIVAFAFVEILETYCHKAIIVILCMFYFESRYCNIQTNFSLNKFILLSLCENDCIAFE